MDIDQKLPEPRSPKRLPSAGLFYPHDSSGDRPFPRASRLAGPAAAPLQPVDYEQVFDRALARIEARRRLLELERSRASHLYGRLVHRSAGQQSLLLWNLPVDRVYSLVALLVEDAHRRVFDDPSCALARAELATRIARRLDVDHYGASLVAEISARAWACLGHAARIVGHLGRSAEAFARAHERLAESPGEPLEEGCLLDLQSSLLGARGELLEAGSLLDRAADRFRLVGDDHRVGRVEIKRGVVELRRGLDQPALDRLCRGLERAEGARDPYAVAVGHALRAALEASPTAGTVEVRPWDSLRRARRWAQLPAGRPVVALIRKVEASVVRGRLSSAELLPVWPRRL